MAKYDYDLIVIGAGAAGLTASTGASSLGAKTLLIEKENKLGGDCLHYGCVPSKSLIKSAHVYHLIKKSAKYGLPDIDVPRVDMKKIMDRIRGIIEEIQVHDSVEYIKDKYGVESAFGQPQFIDKHTIDLHGQKISSKNFIIATGSSPMLPPIQGLDQVDYLTNADVFSIDYLPESLIVLGGGPIGLEMAQSFSRLGSQVTIVEFADRLLSKEDSDISGFVQQKLEDEGVSVLTGHKAVKALQADQTVKIKIENVSNSQTRELSAQTVLVATGRKANVDGLGLANIGLKYSSKGIAVDKHLRTNVSNIYACGDVNGGYQFTHVAGYEAGIAMVNAVLRLPAVADYTKVPWVTYLDPEIASIGYNEWMATQQGIDYEVHIDQVKDNHRAITESNTEGFIKILISKGRPIGVQIVGVNAGDLIAEWVAILNGKVSLSTISQAIHPYPTRAEMNKLAVGNYMAPQFFNNSIIKWLAKF